MACDSARGQGFCGDVVTAEPFAENNVTKQILKDQQKKLARNGLLPEDMDTAYTFSVYWLQSDFARHASIVYSPDGEHFLTAELQWYFDRNGTRRCLPWVNGFKMSEHKDRRSKMTLCGWVRVSTSLIIAAGVLAMRRFGKYGKLTNNCQNYCNLVLAELGLPQQWTDTQQHLLFPMCLLLSSTS